MLPTGKRDRGTAIQVILYTCWTILVSLIPAFGVTGKLFLTPVSAAIILILGLGMLYYAFQLYKEKNGRGCQINVRKCVLHHLASNCICVR